MAPNDAPLQGGHKIFDVNRNTFLYNFFTVPFFCVACWARYKEIFQCIQGDLSILSFQAWLQDRSHLVVDHMASQCKFFGWWRWDSQLVTVHDTFKDKVNYSHCCTFEQLELLNDKLIVLAEQYHVFEGSNFAMTELRQYLTNYKLIQTAMHQVNAQFQANSTMCPDLDCMELVTPPHKANLTLAKLAHLGVHLANMQGQPLFNMKVDKDMEIRGITTTREGNLAILWWEVPHEADQSLELWGQGL
jgi:hypothetical protein